jgi:hypothetical protein
MKDEDETVRQRYRVRLASRDFMLAKQLALHLLKKGHHKPYHQLRGASQLHQTAYTTAFVVIYNRPFSGSRGWKPLKIEEANLSPEELLLHIELRDLRNEVHAHTDHQHHDRQPWKPPREGREINIITEPPYHLSKQQLENALLVLDKLKLHYCPPKVIKRIILPEAKA